MTARPCEVCGSTEFTEQFEKERHRVRKCSACGLERLEPQPSDVELAGIYGRHYYEAWGLAQDPVSVARLKRATFDRRIRLLHELPRGARVLDCGAATGLLMESARAAGFEPYGVELSSYGAGAIASVFGESRVFCGEVTAATFPGLPLRPFAAIFMYDFLEHVRDPRAVLIRAHDLLSPNGVISICTPEVGSFSHRVMGTAWRHYKPEHLYYFSRRNLGELLSACGFIPIRTFPAWKALTFDYLLHQFEAYPLGVLADIGRAVQRLCPPPFRKRVFWALIGEILVHARAA